METATVEKTSLWHNRNFVSLWTSETISQFGSQFTQLALPLTAVIILGATAEELGILGFAGSISWLLFGLLVGVYVDRHRKKRIMVTANIHLGSLLLLGLSSASLQPRSRSRSMPLPSSHPRFR